MASPIKLPREILTRDEVASRADEFLAKYHPEATFPVPIREIVEFGLGISVVSGFALENISAEGVDAYLTPDMQEVRVDVLTEMHNPRRCRFSLAHEAAHVILHERVYKEIASGLTVGAYRELMANLDQKELGFIEWQANEFAGRVLVPKSALVDHFNRLCKEIGANPCGQSGEWEALVPHLAAVFDVSNETIRLRCINDGLVTA